MVKTHPSRLRVHPRPPKGPTIISLQRTAAGRLRLETLSMRFCTKIGPGEPSGIVPLLIVIRMMAGGYRRPKKVYPLSVPCAERSLRSPGFWSYELLCKVGAIVLFRAQGAVV